MWLLGKLNTRPRYGGSPFGKMSSSRFGALLLRWVYEDVRKRSGGVADRSGFLKGSEYLTDALVDDRDFLVFVFAAFRFRLGVDTRLVGFIVDNERQGGSGNYRPNWSACCRSKIGSGLNRFGRRSCFPAKLISHSSPLSDSLAIK